MTTERSVIIGFDDDLLLPAIIQGIKKVIPFSCSISCVSHASDLLTILGSLSADLVILCYRNTCRALQDLALSAVRPALPVLCLVQRSEDEAELFSRHTAVFTFPLDHVRNSDYLGARIQSIFLLGGKHPEATINPPTTTAVRPENDHADLSRYVMELDKKTEVLMKVKDRIAHLYTRVDDPTRVELNSIVNAIRISANDARVWDDFKIYFEQNNPGFLWLLAQKHPGLTPKDLKYCCYLKMNMTNDDIRSLLGINQESVRTHKYRLKKKMRLSKEQSLRTYLMNIEPGRRIEHSFFPATSFS